MQFRQFCSELMRLKATVERLAPATAGSPDTDAEQNAEPGTDSGPSAASPDNLRVEDLRLALLSLLEQQAQRTGATGGSLGYGLYREAEYVMAALADETFLNANWTGRSTWRLLEQELFQSHASGDLFFRRLDHLLNTGGSNDLALIYYLALALDFQGRYRNADPGRQLERYRRQLYLRIYRQPIDEAAPEPIFAQSYEFTAIDDEPRRLHNAQLWWLVLGGVVTVWLVASTLLWVDLTAPIAASVQHLLHSLNAGRNVRP